MSITERIQHCENSYEFWKKDTRDKLGTEKQSSCRKRKKVGKMEGTGFIVAQSVQTTAVTKQL